MTALFKLKALPVAERPRERLMLYGPETLSSAELIAIILGSGIKGKSVLLLAQELIIQFGSLNKIQEASVEELCKVKGLGKTKAIQLKAALSLALRIEREKMENSEKIDGPLTAYFWAKNFVIHEKKEVFGVILLNAKRGAFRWEVISIGTLTQTLVHPREVFYPAVRYLAAAFILVHNHPSGDPTPSAEDHEVTRMLIEASKSLAIPILDHIIIAKGGFISLKESGIEF